MLTFLVWRDPGDKQHRKRERAVRGTKRSRFYPFIFENGTDGGRTPCPVPFAFYFSLLLLFSLFSHPLPSPYLPTTFFFLLSLFGLFQQSGTAPRYRRGILLLSGSNLHRRHYSRRRRYSVCGNPRRRF